MHGEWAYRGAAGVVGVEERSFEGRSSSATRSQSSESSDLYPSSVLEGFGFKLWGLGRRIKVHGSRVKGQVSRVKGQESSECPASGSQSADSSDLYPSSAVGILGLQMVKSQSHIPCSTQCREYIGSFLQIWQRSISQIWPGLIDSGLVGRRVRFHVERRCSNLGPTQRRIITEFTLNKNMKSQTVGFAIHSRGTHSL